MTLSARAQTSLGAAVLAALAFGAVFLVAIAPGLGRGDALSVRVYFLELGGLREDAEVRAAAATVGRVRSISLSPAGAAGPLAGKAGVVVELAVWREHARRTWRDGQIVVSARGLLGTRYVELLPPADAPGLPLADGDEVRGVDPPTLDRVLLRAWTNLEIARHLARDLAPEVSRLRRELTALREALRELEPDAATAAPAVAAELAPLLDELLVEGARAWAEVLDGGETLSRLDALGARAHAVVAAARGQAQGLLADLSALEAEVAAILARVGAKDPVGRLGEAVARLRGLAGRVSELRTNAVAIWQRWERREGSIGRILADPEFPEDAKALGKILKRQPWRIVGRPKEEVEKARGP